MTGPAPAWAILDAAFYRARYPDAVAALSDTSDSALLAFYLATGQGLGHSPNPWFDERWYRRAFPMVAQMVERGEYASGMDHYCRRGHCLAYRPHWLFDERYYRGRYKGLSDPVLRDHQLANGYDHFLRSGDREGRIGHGLFDPVYFLAAVDPDSARTYQEVGPYRAFLGRAPRAEPEPRTTILFDPVWYRTRYPEVTTAIAAGEYGSALEHYLCNDTPERFDPLPQFSETWYRQRNPDVTAAIAGRHARNGYTHFLNDGRTELRSPAPTIDLHWYSCQETVAADLGARKASDAFTHLLALGLSAGLPTAPPLSPPAPVAPHSTTPDSLMLPALGRMGLDFRCDGPPSITVVIAPHDGFTTLMVTLAAVRDGFSGGIDLVLIDRGSTDAVRAISRHVVGAQILRFETRIEERAAFSAALRCARADAILFLSADARPAHGGIRRALNHLRHDPTIGIVGGMTIDHQDRIADAGGVLWDDGTLDWYAAGASPLTPEANVRCDIDCVPPHCLFGRTRLLMSVNAFAESAPSLEHAAALAALALRAQDARVVYDPAIIVRRPNLGEPLNSEESRALLRERGGVSLTPRHAPPSDAGSGPWIAPRRGNPGGHRVLYLDDTVPLRFTGSGFVRSNDVIRTMDRMGYAVTVFPIMGCRHDLASVSADLPDTVEVLHDRDLADLPAFLAAREGWFDTIWVSRIHNFDLVVPILTAARALGAPMPKLVLDTEAIASERRHARLILAGESLDLRSAIAEELRNASMCDHVVAVSERDARTLREAGLSSVSVIGHIRTPTPTPRCFADRQGLLFVGAMHEQDSPNHDSLCWFVDAVLPLIEKELGWETRLTVAGYTGPGVSLARFQDHPRITLRGAVPDLTPLYDSHRLFIAPTRFAAGMPYKVQEAASFGLPVVAASLLAEQLDWHDDHELLATPTGDAAAMAGAILGLYRDEARWTRLRETALRRLVAENAPDHYVSPLREVLERKIINDT